MLVDALHATFEQRPDAFNGIRVNVANDVDLSPVGNAPMLVPTANKAGVLLALVSGHLRERSHILKHEAENVFTSCSRASLSITRPPRSTPPMIIDLEAFIPARPR